MMKSRIMRFAVCIIAAVCVLPLCLSVFAVQQSGARYTNPNTGYQVLIRDDDDLLSVDEENALAQKMIPITDYGHIVFWSTDDYAYDEIEQAKDMRILRMQFVARLRVILSML